MKMRLEGTFRESIDGEWLKKHEADEIDYSKDSYDYLFDDELEYDINSESYDDKKEISAEKNESDTIKKILAESEMGDEELASLWGKNDLGKYTINTPIQEKQAAQNEDRNTQPISELEFQEISDEVDREDAEMQEKFKQMAEELEGIF